MKDAKVYLIHVAECIARIEEYTAGGREAFLTSPLIQDATLRNLHTLTESTQKLPEAWKDRFPQTDWRGIAGFRNIIVHDYLGVDLPRVWAIIERDLPALKHTIEAMLKELEASP